MPGGITNANSVYGNPSTVVTNPNVNGNNSGTQSIQQTSLYNTLGGNFGQALPSFLMQSGYSPYSTGNPMVAAMTRLAPQFDAMSQWMQATNNGALPGTGGGTDPFFLQNPALANQAVYNAAITGGNNALFTHAGGAQAYNQLRQLAGQATQGDNGLPQSLNPNANFAMSLLSGQNSPQFISNLLYGNNAGQAGSFLRDWTANTLPSLSEYAFEHNLPGANYGPSSINFLDILGSLQPSLLSGMTSPSGVTQLSPFSGVGVDR